MPTGGSRAFASTKAPGTPAPTSAACGPSSGTLLGQVTFTNESASGWQEADFPSPVPVAADTTYVVSYFAPIGRLFL
jgi:hypothetical protein